MARRSETDPQPGPTNRPEGVQLRARRSPRLVAVGVMTVVLGALGGAALYANLAQQESAVAMARDVPRGQPITADDLTIVEVPAGFGVDTTDGNSLSSFVGKRALTDLPAGSFPSAEHLGTSPLPEGHQLVGLKLPQGRIPVTDLPQGTPVQLVGLEDQSVVDAFVVAAPTLSEDGSGLVVDVAVPAAEAVHIARLAATDQVALVGLEEK